MNFLFFHPSILHHSIICPSIILSFYHPVLLSSCPSIILSFYHPVFLSSCPSSFYRSSLCHSRESGNLATARIFKHNQHINRLLTNNLVKTKLYFNFKYYGNLFT
ncbi:MAG: hypothetical protein OXJ52_08390 [Oligoflexia bacterium]|nr:hypothetical protein [Oligoflexia bacterium]